MVCHRFYLHVTTQCILHVAATTHALLGTTLSDKHGAYRNKRLLRVAVQKKKEESVPAGLQWPGTSIYPSGIPRS